MNTRRTAAGAPIGIATVILLASCGNPPENDTGEARAVDTATANAECTDAPGVTWENWGEGFFITWCQACHSAISADRNGAPEGINFDTEAEVRTWTASIQHTVLEEGSMPMGGGLGDKDRALLEFLLACGL